MILALGVHGAEAVARLLGGEVCQLIKAGHIGVVGHAAHLFDIADIQGRSGNAVDADLHAGNNNIGVVVQYGGVVGFGGHNIFVGVLVGLYPALAGDEIAAGGNGQGDGVLLGVKAAVGLTPVLVVQSQLLLGKDDGLSGNDGLHIGVVGCGGAAGITGLVSGGNRKCHGAYHQHSQRQCKCFFHGNILL